MKQCPACNRTYANDKQKFCTQDGIALVDAHSASAGQGETVRIDSAELEIPKPVGCTFGFKNRLSNDKAELTSLAQEISDAFVYEKH